MRLPLVILVRSGASWPSSQRCSVALNVRSVSCGGRALRPASGSVRVPLTEVLPARRDPHGLHQKQIARSVIHAAGRVRSDFEIVTSAHDGLHGLFAD
jgi:hypothetical protein